MTNDEKWEVLRVNIESLHASCSELHASVADMRLGIADMRQAIEENDRRLSARMAELIENNIRLSNIIIAHDPELGDHERRIEGLEG